ncbi:ParD-like family protein [Bacterioplanoides pacificum]|uniref:ParD-like family protein n=1 Tax=Bacterioplanoides pacificum TaxID=1171596 RepID=A0ABV7VWM2_9GAMM
MGIVKISDELHEEIRKSSAVMSRSINSQAEFWIRMGMLAELNPELTFRDIVQQQLEHHQLDVSKLKLQRAG